MIEVDTNIDEKNIVLSIRRQGTTSKAWHRPLTIGEQVRLAHRAAKLEEGKEAIEDVFCSFETAKLLDKAGFIPTTGCVVVIYNEKGESVSFDDKDAKYFYQAPTLDVALRWLRKVKNIFVTIGIGQYAETGAYYYDYMVNAKLKPLVFSKELYASYEEASEASIKYCLENLETLTNELPL